MWKNRGDSLRSATEEFEPSCGCRQLQEHLVHAVEKKTTSCVGISDHVWTRHVIWVCIFTDGKLCSSISRTIRHWTSNKNVMD